MGNPRCKWVCDRLPLLAGDDLQGLDRRRVERHLIGCPHCREHQESLGRSLEVLRAVSATPPVPADTSSLWPALERQIRESRRSAPVPAFALPAWLAWPRPSFGPALGLAAGLLVASGIGLAARHQLGTALAHIAANERPISGSVAAPGLRTAESSDPATRQDFPMRTESTVVETSPPPRVDYDLDHGLPMPPEGRDSRDTKVTY